MKILHLLPPHENKKPGINRAWCGKYVNPWEITDINEQVSCPSCKKILEEYERNEV